MTKKLLATLMIMMFAITSISIAFADDGPGGNKRKGKYTYRKVYKACMETGEVQSATPTISPADKKRAEWDEIFQNKQFNEFGCSDNWAQLSDKDITDIYSYFWGFASDSPSPATCK